MIEEDENIYVEDSEEDTPEVEPTTSISEIQSLKKTIFDKAKEFDVPYQFIKMYNGNLVNIVDIISPEKTILENYKLMYENNITFENPNIFLLAFYLRNKDTEKEYLIKNFNLFKNIVSKGTYYEASFNFYKKNFEEELKILMKNSNEKSKKYYNIFEKIKNLDFYQTEKEILQTYKIFNSEVIYKIIEKDYSLEPLSGKVIFDKIKLNEFFQFMRYDFEENKKEESYYKIYTKNQDYKYYIDFMKSVPYEKNTLTLLMNPYIRNNLLRGLRVKIDFNLSNIQIQFSERTLVEIKEEIQKILPDLIFEKEIEKSIDSEFKIIWKNYGNFKFYFMTLFDDVAKEFFYIREENSLRCFKENMKIYYVDPDTTVKKLNYSLSFNITKYNGELYSIRVKSKEMKGKKEKIREFIYILARIIFYYNNYENDILNIIGTPYTGVDGNGLGYSEDFKSSVKQVKKKQKKLDNLIKYEPNLFSRSKYARSCPCPQQPIIIDKEDKEDWEKYKVNGQKKEVVIFPPENSKTTEVKNYYVCPDDNYNFVSFKENPDKLSKEFPLVPCCSVKKTNQDLYENYDNLEQYKILQKHRGNQENILKTFKTLSSDRSGNVPDKIIDFFKKIISQKILRLGVNKNSKSSFIQCIFKSLDGFKFKTEDYKQNEKFLNFIELVLYTYNKKQIDNKDKENFLSSFRRGFFRNKRIGKIFKKDYLSQELYEYSREERDELISDSNNFFDSRYMYRVFEFIFSVNIFIFEFEKTDEKSKVKIETPNNQYYHLREIREELPSIVLLRHKLQDTFDVYELIYTEGEKFEETNSNYVFPTSVTKYFKSSLDLENSYNIDVIDLENVVRKNPLVNINWNKILRDYIIVSQILNSSGRSFSLTFQYSNEDKNLVTIFIKETFPLNVETNEKIFPVDRKTCVELFGGDYIEGSRGLFYRLNDYEKGIFVPCVDVKSKDKSLMCPEYEIMINVDKKNRKLENLKICKNNALKFVELMKWLYLSEKIDISLWFDEHVMLDENIKEEVFSSNEFVIDYRFPKIENTREGIDYLHNFLPLIFNQKIYLYRDLYENIKQHMKNFLKDINLENMKNKNYLENILKVRKDFRDFNFNTNILSDKKYKIWLENIDHDDKKYDDISETDVDKEFPFIWLNKENKKIYFIQNNSHKDLNSAIFVSYIWNEENRNISYETSNYLDFLKRITEGNTRINSIFGFTYKDIINYTNELVSDKELVFFDKFSEYFRYLSSINAPFLKSKNINHVIYTKKDDVIKIEEKFIYNEGEDILEIYLYENGDYASMLNIV